VGSVCREWWLQAGSRDRCAYVPYTLSNTWHRMGVTLAATDALNCFARLVGQDADTLTSGLEVLRPHGKTGFPPYLGVSKISGLHATYLR